MVHRHSSYRSIPRHRSLLDSSRIADKPAFTHAEIDSFLAKRFSLSPRAVFVSRAGEFAGRDSDSIISFERNNGVILGEYGFAYQGYRGSYEVEQGGSIHLHLMGRAAAWPPMKLVLDGAGFLALPRRPLHRHARRILRWGGNRDTRDETILAIPTGKGYKEAGCPFCGSRRRWKSTFEKPLKAASQKNESDVASSVL